MHKTEDPVNIGTAVRALANMGFTDLRLVDPVDYERKRILGIAHHCEELVDSIRHYPDLDAALADVTFVMGTVAVDHPNHPLTRNVRGLAADLLERTAHGRVALLFGPEADGLDLAALDRCHVILSLPVDPGFPALNLSQSLLLVLYEIRMAAMNAPKEANPPSITLATKEEVELVFDLFEQALDGMAFFKGNAQQTMRLLRQTLYRAEMRPKEAGLLMGIARRIRWVMEPENQPKLEEMREMLKGRGTDKSRWGWIILPSCGRGREIERLLQYLDWC